MGNFEVMHFWFFINLFVVVVIGILSIFSFKNILNRFGILKSNRREFYECGFKPVIQKPVQFTIQFTIVCLFFILYDIELIFSFPLVSTSSNHSLLEIITFGFLYGSFVFSLIFDFDQNLTNWKL